MHLLTKMMRCLAKGDKMRDQEVGKEMRLHLNALSKYKKRDPRTKESMRSIDRMRKVNK